MGSIDGLYRARYRPFANCRCSCSSQ